MQQKDWVLGKKDWWEDSYWLRKIDGSALNAECMIDLSINHFPFLSLSPFPFVSLFLRECKS